MDNKLTFGSPMKFTCEKCNFNCSNKKDFNRHLNTAKHVRITKDNNSKQLPLLLEYTCECGKCYKHKSGLCKHKHKCAMVQNPPKEEASQPANQFLKDEIIERLVKELMEERKALMEQKNETNEIKSMFVLMIEKYQEATKEMVKGNQELVNKFIEIAPKMGNTTNNNDNRKITFNYYLENHCKEGFCEANTPLIEQSIK
jgi:hypothetical protein